MECCYNKRISSLDSFKPPLFDGGFSIKKKEKDKTDLVLSLSLDSLSFLMDYFDFVIFKRSTQMFAIFMF